MRESRLHNGGGSGHSLVMIRTLKWTAGWLVALILWLWTTLPRALDLVGRTTLPEDWQQLMTEKLPAWAAWLFSTPWWVPAILATGLTVWLIWWVSRPAAASTSQSPERPSKTATHQPETTDAALLLVENKNFSDTSRLLDGFYYKNCNFHNVQFTFNGGEYTIDGGSITGHIGLTSASNPVNAAYLLLLTLQSHDMAIPENTKIEKDVFGNVSVTIDRSSVNKAANPTPQSPQDT